ncbi:hypothetical protein D0869_03698 [Hortaea werneckii]|uniref:Uncharacterized protein n=1 Tax=Hortaea werneckii TaxID=91943 RepID=A0A3M6Y019_HORWE|nr:hypothetical protein KC324_g7653 [Hortaea werneckii]KAI7532887.1 hypothetical protein KC316_g16899 [Hortaea werneckii]RMX85594.1 hypothetical protein D0869_03698 [Hortaea werneckii]RMX96367.1 hypothetical protein D0868_11217 [Hortaea werneckii]
MERSEKAVPQLSSSQEDRTASTPKVESSRTIINHVLERLPVDALSALAAGIVVAPIVYVIDTAVIEAALGRRTVGRAVRSAATDLALQPHRIVRSKPFSAMLALYSGTYMTVNVVDTTTAKLQADAFTSTWTKLGTVSTVNMALSLYKDNQFAKAFSGNLVTRAMPARSYVPFVIRDGITIFASFNLPPALASQLPERWEDRVARLSIAQLIAPAASQIVVTPLHLLGLDLYYRQGRLSIRERILAMRRGCVSGSLARMIRVIPGLAFGNVINTKLHSSLGQNLE